mgnify:CR=1 FL=1
MILMFNTEDTKSYECLSDWVKRIVNDDDGSYENLDALMCLIGTKPKTLEVEEEEPNDFGVFNHNEGYNFEHI